MTKNLSGRLPGRRLPGAATAAVVALTLGSLSVAGTAAAATGSFTDRHGDMPHGADIHRVTVVNDDAVRVRIRHADLVRSYTSGSSLALYVDTGTARPGPEYVFLGGLFEGADYALLRARDWRQVGTRAVDCHVLMRLDYADDVTRVRLPRRCFGDASRVRVSVKTGGEVDGRSVVDWLGGRRHLTRWVGRG